VDAGQGDDEPGCRGGGSSDRVVDGVLAQRLQHGGGGPAPDLDSARGLRKITRLAAQKANRDRRAHRLEPDPATAATVRWIFAQRLAGHSVARIARALNEAAVPCPRVSQKLCRG